MTGHHPPSFKCKISPDHNHLCAKCKHLPTDAVQSLCHYFCRNCIFSHLENETTCPQCAKVILKTDVMQVPRAHKDYYNNVIVICNSCNTEMTRSAFEKHASNCDKQKKSTNDEDEWITFENEIYKYIIEEEANEPWIEIPNSLVGEHDYFDHLDEAAQLETLLMGTPYADENELDSPVDVGLFEVDKDKLKEKTPRRCVNVLIKPPILPETDVIPECVPESITVITLNSRDYSGSISDSCLSF